MISTRSEYFFNSLSAVKRVKCTKEKYGYRVINAFFQSSKLLRISSDNGTSKFLETLIFPLNTPNLRLDFLAMQQCFLSGRGIWTLVIRKIS
jgi:hypothetical protein